MSNPTNLGRYGHHPDQDIDAEVELGRLQGLLAEAHAGLLRALDYRAATPEGLAIRHDVRDALRRSGFTGNLGAMGDPSVTPSGSEGSNQTAGMHPGPSRRVSDAAGMHPDGP